ncbi:MAG: SDR family NAD(P)-dependent oxidoreductase, partial [Candidatus Electrothrix sp. ATG2]|nr:SDR family NAD(P)-dependent oxidoreductase [Candidatus Electrothrix sp. ATG2]
MNTFTEQKAVVTGATRGIGRAITESLLAQGATVVGVYSGNEEAAAELAKNCSAPERLRLHKIDVSDYQAVEGFFKQVEEEFDT